MEHIFIVNPAAGNSQDYRKTMEDIRRAASGENIRCHIYATEGADEAKQLVCDWCERGLKVRFYACGGDGTLQVIAAAAARRPNAEVGTVPIGTGNDFVRNFDNVPLFLDLKEQIRGVARPVDLIEYKEPDTGFCTYGVNMINIGFDSDAAAQMQRIKYHPIFGGSRAYVFGVIRALAGKLGKQMEIKADGEQLSGEFLLTAAANGRFCGGGFMAAPAAALDDGLMDLHIIKKVGRARFLSLVGKYRNGTYLKSPQGQKVSITRRCREIEFKASEKINIAIDGEIRQGKELTLKAHPKALLFSAPLGCW